MRKHRDYKELKTGRRYLSEGFWCTLVHRGYHPKTGAHRPRIKVVETNAYLLEAQLESGTVILDDYIYRVLEWSHVSAIYDERYDSTTYTYDLVLSIDASPYVRKVLSYLPDTYASYGITRSKTGWNCHVAGVLCRLIKKSKATVGIDYHEPVISVDYYNVDLIKYQLNQGLIEFNNVDYLVLGWHEIPVKQAFKKDGRPYVRTKKFISMKLKINGRVTIQPKKNRNMLDLMLETA